MREIKSFMDDLPVYDKYYVLVNAYGFKCLCISYESDIKHTSDNITVIQAYLKSIDKDTSVSVMWNSDNDWFYSSTLGNVRIFELQNKEEYDTLKYMLELTL